jgi:hypothetical protein
MPSQSRELFLLSSTTPSASAFYGQAAARGSAEVDASFRRGIDLSAEFDFRAHVQGSVGEELAATFSGGVGLRGGLAFEAAFPIDLFTEAGIVTRFQAQLAAVAYVSAALELELDEFYRRVHGRVPAGPMDRLLEIFFDEVAVEAGLWARATFAAEVLGEATLTGSLLPNASGGPGFTYSLQYGAGFGYGTGFEFRTNFGIEEPRRLLDRMSATTTELILAEVNRYVGQLSPDQARAARKAVGVLRTLLPLAMRSTFQLGIDLAGTDSAGQRSVAAASMVKSVVREAQEQLLRAAVDIAVGQLGRLLGTPTTTQAFLKLAPAKLYRAMADFDTLRKQFEQLTSVQVTEVDRWLAALVACLPPLEDLLAIGALPPAVTDECRKALALFWSAATLVNRVVSWVDDPARGAGELFGATPVAVPANSTIAAYVASRIGKPAGSALTFADLVRFVLGLDLEAQLRTASPEVADALSWLGSALGSQAGGLARRLLVELVDPAPDEVQRLLRTMSEAFSQAIDEEVVPRLLDPMKAADPNNKPLALFIDELVKPNLVALPLVVLPRIAELGTPEMEVRFREALSAVVLQSLQRFVLSSVDVLLEHALNEGEGALRDAGRYIGEMGRQAPAFGVIATVATGAFLPLSITPADAEGLLVLSADIIHLWNTEQRQSLLDATGALLALGLATEDTRNATFDRLLGTDDPASGDDLGAALERTTDGLWEIVKFAGPELLKLIALHFWHVLEVWVDAIVQGAREVVKAAKAAAQWLAQTAQQLLVALQELGRKIAELTANIARAIQTLAAHLRGLASRATAAIRAAGSELIRSLTPDWAEGAILRIYNVLFDVIDWVVSRPLEILSSVAGWVADVLEARSGMVANDEQAVHEEVRRRIMSVGAPDLTFHLRLTANFPWGGRVTLLDLGRVTLRAGDILGAVAGTVFGEQLYNDTVSTTSRDAVARMAARAQEQTTRQAYQGTLNQQQAMLASGTLVPGHPLSVRLTSPAGSSTNVGQAALNVRIEGANKTFVQPTLGVPRRVSLIINGVEYPYDAAHWASDSNGISYAASIIPVPSPSAAVPTPQETVLNTHERTTATGITATVSDDGGSVRFVAESPTGPKQLGVVDASELFGEPTWASASAADQSAADQSVAAAPVGGATAPVLAVGSVTVSGQTTQQMSQGDVITFEPIIPGEPFPGPKPAFPVPIGSTSQPVIHGRPGLNVVQVAVADGEQYTASESVVFFLEAAPDTESPSLPPKVPTETLLFGTGFESGEVQPTWNDSFNHPPQNVSGFSPIIGPQCSTRENEVAHSGVVALMYSGTAGGAVPCYCYFQVFDVTIAITGSTRLAYWIYPQQDNGRYVAVDFICTDGTTLRDSGSVDQNGASMHPNAGHGGAIPINAWSQVVCNLGQRLAGKTIDKILVAFDRPGGRGQFRGYIDNMRIYN